MDARQNLMAVNYHIAIAATDVEIGKRAGGA